MIVSILRPSPPGIIVLIPLARVLSPSCPFTGGMPGMLVMTFHSKSLAAIVASRTGSGSSNSLRNSVANSFFSADVIGLSPIATDRYLVHPAGSRQHPAQGQRKRDAKGQWRCDTHGGIRIVRRLAPEN